MYRQYGGALTEFFFLTMIMVPLFFAIPMVGKLIDLKQTTIQASRYSAWEATVYPSGANGNMPTAIKERFFGDNNKVLVSHSSEAWSNSMWGDKETNEIAPWWDDTKVVIDEDSVSGVPYQETITSQGIGFEIGNQASNTGEILDGISGNEWDFESNGFVRADINLDIQESTWLERSQGSCGGEDSYTCIKASSVIMSDGWSASGDNQTRRRVRSLMPASILEPVGDAVSLLRHLPVLEELNGLKDAFGHVDMNVLPPYEPQN